MTHRTSRSSGFTHKIYAKGYLDDAQRAVNTLANELERLAQDLRKYAELLPGTLSKDSRPTPTGVASCIVDLYLNQVGKGSVRLSELVTTAGQAEAHRALICSHRGQADSKWSMGAR